MPSHAMKDSCEWNGMVLPQDCWHNLDKHCQDARGRHRSAPMGFIGARVPDYPGHAGYGGPWGCQGHPHQPLLLPGLPGVLWCWGYEGDTYSWIYPYNSVYSYMGCWGPRDPGPRDAEGSGWLWRVLKVWELPKVLWVLGILVSLEVQGSWRSHGVPGDPEGPYDSEGPWGPMEFPEGPRGPCDSAGS